MMLIDIYICLNNNDNSYYVVIIDISSSSNISLFKGLIKTLFTPFFINISTSSGKALPVRPIIRPRYENA